MMFTTTLTKIWLLCMVNKKSWGTIPSNRKGGKMTKLEKIVVWSVEEFRKEVMTAIEDFNTSEKEKNKMKGFFLRALKPHKAKIKLNLLDY